MNISQCSECVWDPFCSSTRPVCWPVKYAALLQINPTLDFSLLNEGAGVSFPTHRWSRALFLQCARCYRSWLHNVCGYRQLDVTCAASMKWKKVPGYVLYTYRKRVVIVIMKAVLAGTAVLFTKRLLNSNWKTPRAHIVVWGVPSGTNVQMVWLLLVLVNLYDDDRNS